MLWLGAPHIAVLARGERLDWTARAVAMDTRSETLLLDAVPLPIWSVTVTGEVTEVNAAWVAYTGLTREQTQGNGWVATMLPDDIARARERWQCAQASGEHYELEFRLRRAVGGAYRWHLVRIAPLHDARGRLVGWLATALDIDERKRMEEDRDRLLAEMRAARDRLQQVLDTLPEGMLIVDPAGRVVLVNRVAQEMLGDLVGQSVSVAAYENDAYGVRHLNGSPYPIAERPLHRALCGETVRGDRYLVRWSGTGQEIPMLVNSAPLCATDGTVTGAIAVFQDISALRDLEHTQEEFLSAAAHDLKTPLTAVRGHTGLARLELMRLPGAAATLARLDQIEAGTVRMARLIDELVDVALIQAGAALELDLEPVDLVALVRGVVAQQADLSAHPIGVMAAVPELWATVDAARIERVVSNLLSNAVKYSPQDEAIVVRISQSSGLATPAAVIAVQDRGVGIPPQDLPYIFERFRRAQNVVGHVQGTGIGLASVRQIVEQHGGTVQVESDVGAGATFTVRLPLGAPTERDGTESALPGRIGRRKERQTT